MHGKFISYDFGISLRRDAREWPLMSGGHVVLFALASSEQSIGNARVLTSRSCLKHGEIATSIASAGSGDPSCPGIMGSLCASPAPLLAKFGELDTPEAVKANVSAIRQSWIRRGRRDYTVKVYPKGSTT